MLTLWRPTQTRSFGASSKWEEAGRIRAERVKMTPRSIEENSEAWADYAAVFRIRMSRRPIHEGWRVSERGDSEGRRYVINNIIVDRALGMATIHCDRANL
ncbi:MAG: head-tail adaptor protein [Alloprevotella sp.]|nr:head-tail adaptor protein [Alloprevotella sp.]